MFSTYNILQLLGHQNPCLNGRFINLADDTDQLLDCRLNVFRRPDGRWALAIEKLLFDPELNAIFMEIYYYGNCIIPMEEGINYYEMIGASLHILGKGAYRHLTHFYEGCCCWS